MTHRSDREPRVLMVVDTAPPQYGGAGRQAYELARRLPSRGVKVRIVARKKENLRSVHPGVSFIGPFIKNEKVSNAVFALLVGLQALVGRYDIIHAHGAYYYGWTALAAAHIRRKPSVLKVTLMGRDDPASIRALRQFGVPVGKIIVRQFDYASRIIALTREIEAAVRDEKVESTVEWVPNGVAPVDLHTQSEAVGFTPPSDYILFVGEVCWRKGADVLVDAFRSFADTHPAAHLVMVGPLNDEVAPATTALVRDLPSRVHLLGSQQFDVVSKLLSGARVFCLPSRAEGLPNALLEAMVHGRASVVSDIPAHREVGGDSVLYSTVGRAGDLSAALARAWSDHDSLGGAASAAGAQFEIDAIADVYAKLYLNLMEEDRP
ncbi:glycosyltransferase involved in cell wall biosynthesis [Microbacterium sp. SORGH_AS428]|uniref:glycosyltransferase family 4 protein n=1 Tax=Microbacterium sp. SORGH_AS_0428 TaxID=3041788 RepID=UPI00285B92CC|nr:glycosyltransferase family 4 protein [Microbacterium sp. SORGH_AS_0428]MDR6199296.1 glycosyltransferase involved in cell wall biosynthesis [Microbacterium sp. SORGH_AS_0428]